MVKRRQYTLTESRFDKSSRDPHWSGRLQDAALIGAWSMCLDDGTCWFSKQIYDIYDVPYDLEFAPNPDDFFLDGSNQKIWQAFEKSVQTGESWNIEAPFLSATNVFKWVRSTGQAAVVDGKTMVYGCMQDLTEINRLRTDIESAQKLTNLIVDNIPHSITLKEAKSLRIVRTNRRAQEIYGRRSYQLLGRSDFELFSEDFARKSNRYDQMCLDRKKAIEINDDYLTVNEENYIFKTKKVPIEDKNGDVDYILSISDDITHSREQEQKIAQQNVALANAARLSALGEMAGGIAHEINNPLSIISGVAQQITKILEKDSIDIERLQRLSNNLESTVRRIATIVTGLRDFSRDGTKDPFERWTEHDIVTDTLALCSEKMNTHGVDLNISGIEGEKFIDCQVVRISQVFLNLLNNAFDAVTHAEVPNPTISINVVESGEFYDIEISDNGPGVPAHVVDSIMEPFFTTKELGNGTGLGLSISKGIVESHDGNLLYKTSAEGGACFVVRLPNPLSAQKAG